jgi:hypothetical protein
MLMIIETLFRSLLKHVIARIIDRTKKCVRKAYVCAVLLGPKCCQSIGITKTLLVE